MLVLITHDTTWFALTPSHLPPPPSEDLIQVVENPNGTGHAAFTSGLTIAGKTGTAEIKASQDDTTGTELGWFVGMTTNKAPNNLLVVMMAEDVKDKGGSHYVVPKVKKALETIK